jgi:hypothetical protein
MQNHRRRVNRECRTYSSGLITTGGKTRSEQYISGGYISPSCTRLIPLVTTEQGDDVFLHTEIYGNLSFLLDTTSNQGAFHTDTCPVYIARVVQHANRGGLQLPLFVVNTGPLDPGTWPLNDFSDWLMASARFATWDEIKKCYSPCSLNKTLYPANAGELFANTLYGTLEAYFNGHGGDAETLGRNALLVARTYIIWQTHYDTSQTLSGPARKNLTRDIKEALCFRDNDGKYAQRFIDLQRNVSTSDWFTCLLQICMEDGYMSQRQYLTGLWNIFMGLFLQEDSPDAVTVHEFREVAVRMIFEREARHIQQIATSECFTHSDLLALVLSKAGKKIEYCLKLWGFIFDVLQVVLKRNCLIDDPFGSVCKLSSLRERFQDMSGLLPLTLALSPTSLVSERNVAEVCLRASTLGRHERLDCSLLSVYSEDEKFVLDEVIASNHLRRLTERKRVIDAEQKMKSRLPSSASPGQVGPGEQAVLSWSDVLGDNHPHIHTGGQIRTAVQLLVSNLRDHQFEPVRKLVKLLTTPIDGSIPFGIRRLRTLMIEFADERGRQEMNLPKPDRNNYPNDRNWIDSGATVSILSPPHPVVNNSAEQEDIKFVPIQEAIEQFQVHRDFLRSIVSGTRDATEDNKLCIICFERSSKLKPLHPPSSPNAKPHRVCPTCWPRIMATHTCPECRTKI